MFVSLERELQSVLNFASRVHRAGGSETGNRGLASDGIVGRAACIRAAIDAARDIPRAFKVATVEVGVVQQVEEVELELNSIPLFDLPVLGQLHVGRAGVRAVAGSTVSVAYRTDLVADQRECPGVQDLVAALP